MHVKLLTGYFVLLLSIFFAQVCDLLDLLGDTEEILKPSPAAGGTAPGLPTNAASTVGGDLLDLLGGLEPAPVAPGLILGLPALVTSFGV